MDGAEGKREESMNSALYMNGGSKDLQHKIRNRNQFSNENEQKKEEEVEELELGLGLSMNGRFGVDPTRKKLKRSASISNLVCTAGSADSEGSRQARAAASESYAPLVRTCSLPSETDEWRRLKDFKSARCMEARKKRMEKLKNVEVINVDDSSSEDVNDENDENDLHPYSDGSFDNGVVGWLEKSNRTASSLGSVGLARSGSSRNSDLQSQLMEGSDLNAAMKSRSGVQALHGPGKQQPSFIASNTTVDRDGELLKNALPDMPHVSTKGHGPNKVEGFLYRYRKGEDIRIVCVCHGMFFSPAEFVKHGGGGDVDHPLKHIVVNPFPLV